MMEDGTVIHISNAYILTQVRRKTTTNIGRQRIAICNCNCNVKKEIKPPQWGGKTSFKDNNKDRFYQTWNQSYICRTSEFATAYVQRQC
jgi:hypothetical protein